MEKTFKYSGQNPVQHTGISLKNPKKIAAGIPAILSALKFVKTEVGISNGVQLLNSINQKGGFDCPGCAWPTLMTRGLYCQNTAKMEQKQSQKNIQKLKLTLFFFSKHTVAEMLGWSDHKIGKSGRLSHPMTYNPNLDKYVPISWESAFQRISKELKALVNPNEAIFYTSGRTSNEAAFLYQLMARKFGTNNLPDCSNMCHESSGTALSESLGIGKGSVTLDDFNHAELVMVIGQNPGTNHPRMLSALRNTKKNGGKIISINPLPETGLISFKDPQRPIDWVGKGVELTDLFCK